MASNEQNKKELGTKVKDLISRQFHGDFRVAWQHYDRLGKKDDMLDGSELEKLLEDAKVGTFFTRGRWVSGIMDAADADSDGHIRWMEFEKLIKQ